MDNRHTERPSPELLLLLGKLDGKMDAVLQRMDANDKTHDELDVRVTSLEHWRAYILGIAAILSAIIATFATKLTTFLMGTPP